MLELLEMIKGFRINQVMGPVQFLVGGGIIFVAIPLILHWIFKRRRGFSPFFLWPFTLAQVASFLFANYVASSRDLTWDPYLQLACIMLVPVIFIAAAVMIVIKLRRIDGAGPFDIICAVAANMLAPFGISVAVIMIAAAVVMWVLMKFFSAAARNNYDRYKYDEHGNRRPGS